MKVKEKKVELIELFYDLIYVFAISKMTLVIEEPVGGVIPFKGFFRYLIVSFVILQAWLYLTNYVNRYGRWKWYEYALTAVNMTATVFMANTINSDWAAMNRTFNLSMTVMLLCVAVMYFIAREMSTGHFSCKRGQQTGLKEQNPGAANNSLIILAVDCILYFAAFLVSFQGFNSAVIWMDAVAVLVGAFLPFFIRGKFDASIISFPHLVERFELITIITFGEGIVGMTDFFDVRNFSFRPVLVFAVVLALFGCYVTQIHYLCNHHQVQRALRLMFSHYFVVIAVNLITVAFKFLENLEADRMFTAVLMAAAMVLFFISVFSDSIYYHDRYRFTGCDGVCSAAVLIAGALVMILFKDSIYGFLIGAFIMASGNFLMLVAKYKRNEKTKEVA